MAYVEMSLGLFKRLIKEVRSGTAFVEAALVKFML